MPKVYGYARTSTDEQVNGIEAQKTTIQREFEYRFKDKQDFQWGGWIIDQGVSAKLHFRRRPGAGKLIANLEKGDVIMISKLDRGFRNTQDLANCFEYFEKQKISLIICDLGMDPLSLMGRMIVGILVVIAEFERGMIALRTKEGINAAKRAGHLAGRCPPYGFKRRMVNGKNIMVPDEHARKLAWEFLKWQELGWSEFRMYIHALKMRIKDRLGREYSTRRIVSAIKWARREREKLEAANGQQSSQRPDEGKSVDDSVPKPLGD